MARTRQKKRVITTNQSKELDLVVEDEAGENQQPNQSAEIPEPELEPSPPKQIKLTKKATITSKVTRTTRASTKRTTSRIKVAKSDSVPTPPPPSPPLKLPRAVSIIPDLVVSEDLADDSLSEETQPEIRISRLPQLSDSADKKSASIINPTSSTPDRDEISSPKATQQSYDSSESPRNVSTEQVRNYMSPNDALSSTTMYATLGGSLSPQILKDNLDDSSSQLTQRASSSYFNRNIHDKSMINSADQSITSEASFGVTYYFIETTDSEHSDIMEKAYFCLVSRGYTASWLAEKDVANLPTDNESVNFYFVLPVFEGTLFESLQNHTKWRVLSPVAILNFHSRQIPDRNYPIVDVSMERCFITVSGFPREVRKNLEDKMRQMSGQVSSSLKTRTTHIVASSWNTDKCLFTRTHGFPLVMNLNWVEYCWENMRAEVIDAVELSNNRVFRLPVFAGFVICGASLSRRGQERLCDLVIEHGGVYENVLDSFRTTHLVMVKKEGRSYERALENERIKIVSPDWIHESIARGYPLPEQDVSMRKFMNRMVGKMMDFVDLTFKTFSDSLSGSERPSNGMDSDVQVPGSPEPPEYENDEMASDEEPNELA